MEPRVSTPGAWFLFMVMMVGSSVSLLVLGGWSVGLLSISVSVHPHFLGYEYEGDREIEREREQEQEHPVHSMDVTPLRLGYQRQRQRQRQRRHMEVVMDRTPTPHGSGAPRPRPTRMLVGVFSTLEDAPRREKLRRYIYRNDHDNSHGDDNDNDTVCSLSEFLARTNRGVDHAHDRCRVLYTFVVGAAAAVPNGNERTDHRDEYGVPILWMPEEGGGSVTVEDDVTYLNVRENMNDGKTSAWFKYASRVLCHQRMEEWDEQDHSDRSHSRDSSNSWDHLDNDNDNYNNNNNDNYNNNNDNALVNDCPWDYVAKMDSDVLMSMPDLVHALDHDMPVSVSLSLSVSVPHLQPHSHQHRHWHRRPRNVYGGVLCDQLACGVQEACFQALQGRVYMTGQFYFLSLDLATYVSDDARRRTYTEDVDMGLWVHSRNQVLHLVLFNNKNVFWIHNVKSDDKMDTKYREYFLEQPKFPKYSFWQKPLWWE